MRFATLESGIDPLKRSCHTVALLSEGAIPITLAEFDKSSIGKQAGTNLLSATNACLTLPARNNAMKA